MPITTIAHICPVCDMTGAIWIPIWREDVEGWGDERVPCPVCLGKGALTKEEWQKRVDTLRQIEPETEAGELSPEEIAARLGL